ncbi:DUF5615 family PIN-like protein [Desulfofundulus sp. TPOSR]|uniref:DUF5615 family PIN-like protein n=1 Tax=Desulfofundulus sp. TPOSR TaxID=2714340 RepID=UPI001407768E|nr:DUF5615 family PIN-like protein [Desulfofundulus sp. TPOSR]NHM28252.1 DUF5615 family PIN-like protein [Desulfofundulus sp. TPOSR]
MKIYVDENIPSRTVQVLRELGHEVFDHRGTPKEGIADRDLWKIVLRLKCLLITTDKGFVNKRSERHYGIIIVRLRQPNRKKIHERVLRAINQFREDEWPGTHSCYA